MSQQASAIYVGRVRHRRYAPRPHSFAYRLFMTYLDLDELPVLLADRWFRRCAATGLIAFRRTDYLGDPNVPLADAVRDLVARYTGRRPSGPIRVLTHLRQLGSSFNPVSFYYCFDSSTERLEAVIAEVTNTPWGERHAYVLDPVRNLGSLEKQHYRFTKAFHVSPFMRMSQEYDWRLTIPASHLSVHMANLDGGARLFDATLTLRRRELSGLNLLQTLLAHPFMTARVTAGIYLQAARLWAKATPFFPHPNRPPHRRNPRMDTREPFVGAQDTACPSNVTRD